MRSLSRILTLAFECLIARRTKQHQAIGINQTIVQNSSVFNQPQAKYLNSLFVGEARAEIEETVACVHINPFTKFMHKSILR